MITEEDPPQEGSGSPPAPAPPSPHAPAPASPGHQQPPSPVPQPAPAPRGVDKVLASDAQKRLMAGVQKKRHVQRLTIQSLELEDFKSYAGRQTVGPFHKFFSGIVGPNGSGKSNIIDAILFVFGFRASKIRSGKLERLINTKHRPDKSQPNSASVTVNFAEIMDDTQTEDYEVLDETRFSVKRTVTKQGNSSKSEYFLSGKKAGQNEIKDFLMTKGVDLTHNRFLILQGEVEQIALMPPKAVNEGDVGLLEYIEDVIGTAAYKDKIKGKEELLQEIGDQKQSKVARCQAAQGEMVNLESDKKVAEHYLQLEAQSTKASAQLEGFRFVLHKEQHQEKLKEKEEAQKKVEELAADEEESREKVGQLEKEYKSLKAKCDKAEKAAKAAAQLASKAQRKEIQQRERKKTSREKIKKISQRIKTNTATLQELIRDISRTKQDVTTTDAELVDERKLHEELSAKLEEMRESHQEELAPLRSKLEECKKEVLPFQTEVTKAEMVVKSLNGEKEHLSKGADNIEGKLKEEEAKRGELQGEIAKLEATIKQGKEKLIELKEKIQDGDAELKEVEPEQKKVYGELYRLRAKYEELRRQHDESSSGNKVLEFLKKNKIPGVIGRLGDLGAIDSQYDIAISTACGALHHILVETVEIGQSVLEALRTNHVGRCTVLALNITKRDYGGRENQKREVPSCSKRLVDLVKMKDEAYFPAFYSALRDTLVCDDLDTGSKLAYGKVDGNRWRVVTKKGELIETSGTMSGGGRVSQGGMSAKIKESVDPALVRDAYTKLTESEGQYKHLEDRSETLRRQSAEYTRGMKDIEGGIKLDQVKLEGVQKSLGDCEKRIEGLKAELHAHDEAADAEKIEELDAKIQQAEQELEGAKERMAEAEKGVKAIELEMDNVRGINWKTQQYKSEASKNKMSKLEGNLIELKAGLKNKEKALQKGNASLEKDNAELESIKSGGEPMEEDEGDQEDSTQETSEAKKEHKRLEGEFNELRSELDEVAENFNKHKKELAKSETKRADLNHKLSEATKDVQSIQHQLNCKIKDIRDCRASVLKNLEAFGSGFLLPILGDEEGPMSEGEEGDAMEEDQEEEESEDEGTEEDGSSEEEGGRSRKRKRPQPKQKGKKKGAKGEPKAKRPRQGNAPPGAGGMAAIARRFIPDFDEESYARLQRQEAGKRVKELKAIVADIAERTKKLKPNLNTIVEYNEKERFYLERQRELDECVQAMKECSRELGDLKAQRLKEFTEGFMIITTKLKEMYQMLTLGGDAELELKDTADPFEGIIFTVRPPRKSWKPITNLSGGEKTLSSLALVFAFHHFKPSCLYFMDEIDAALDFKNVAIVANYIKQQARNAQFIIVSLRNHCFELANRLVGIYKTDDCTKSITIDPAAFLKFEPRQESINSGGEEEGAEGEQTRA